MQAASASYERRDPESGLLHRVIREHFATLRELEREDEGSGLPVFVENEFAAFIGCGSLSRGFVRLRCRACGLDRFLGFSCKSRTICPSCSARRMHQVTENLIGRALPDVPIRQWVLSPPPALVGLLGAKGEVLAAMNRFFVSAVQRQLERRAKALGIDGGRSGAVTFLQRFSATLRLFPHAHSLVFDGVFTKDGDARPSFHPLAAPTSEDVEAVASEVARKLAKRLEKLGLVNEVSDEPEKATPLSRWCAAVQRERDGLAVVDEAGKVEPVQRRSTSRHTGEAHGFSVHAGVRVAALDREGRTRLCRYVARPPFAEVQLSETADGRIALELSKPHASGASHVVLEPLAFVRRLAWLVPPPFRNQTIYSGVLAAGSKWRKEIIPQEAHREISLPSDGAPFTSRPNLESLEPLRVPAGAESAGRVTDSLARAGSPTPASLRQPSVRVSAPSRGDADVDEVDLERPYWIPWSELLKRVYQIDIACERCGGRLEAIALITDLAVARKILLHVGLPADIPRFARPRGPP